MKKNFFVIVVSCIVIFINNFCFSQIDNEKILPKLASSSNTGTEFVFGFHPNWNSSTGNGSVRIYVSSSYVTEVRVTITKISSEPYQRKYTIPNGIIEFILPLEDAQPYLRGSSGDIKDLKRTQVWNGQGIIVQSDEPIIVYALSTSEGKSDGFFAIPNYQLGQEYIISGYQETSTNTQYNYTPYAEIIAVYDNTKVNFYLGGNKFSKIRTLDGWEWKPYQMIRSDLNKGDMWLIASETSYGDLSGSKIFSNKPVSVLSGNLAAYVPSDKPESNYLIEQETPKISWGRKYFAIPIADRRTSSVVRIFAKEPGTAIFQNNKQIAKLDSNYGIYQKGWVEFRNNPDSNKGAVYISDKPINVVQYNTSTPDDSIESKPFQMNLISEEQFQDDFTFFTPGLKDSSLFDKNYLNIIYRTNQNSEIPEDLELGEVLSDGEVKWQKVKDINPDLGTFLMDPYYADSVVQTYSKTLEISKNGVYRLRSQSQYFGAYLYGFGKSGAYGFPVSAVYNDFESMDYSAPEVFCDFDCTGNTISKKTMVIDMPDDDSQRSNMAYIRLVTENSFNFNLNYEDFIPGEYRSIKWSLKPIDNTKEAKANILFADRAGNVKNFTTYYHPQDLAIIPDDNDFGTVKVGEEMTANLILKNQSEFRTAVIDYFTLKSFFEGTELSGFILDYDFDLGQVLNPGDTKQFRVTFTATQSGTFIDSIGVGDSCVFSYKGRVKADVIDDKIKISVSDIDFGIVKVGSTTSKTAVITNIGVKDLIITGIKSLPLEITTSLPDISSKNPIIIKSGDNYEFTVTFKPIYERNFSDTIAFISNAGPNIDQNCCLKSTVSGKDKYIVVLKPSKPVKLNGGDILEIIWKTSEVFPVSLTLYEGTDIIKDLAIFNLQISYLWKVPIDLKSSKDYHIRVWSSYFPEIYYDTPLLDITNINDIPYSYLKDEIEIYPNPASDYIEVNVGANGRSPLLEDGVSEEIRIFDIFGKCILNVGAIHELPLRIDIFTLPAGVYFVRFGEKVEKFVKM